MIQFLPDDLPHPLHQAIDHQKGRRNTSSPPQAAPSGSGQRAEGLAYNGRASSYVAGAAVTQLLGWTQALPTSSP